MLWLLIVAVVCVVAYVTLGSNRLSLRLRGLFNRKKEDITNNIGKGLDEHTERLKSAKMDVVEFKRNIARFTAEAKRLEAEHAKHVAEADKWSNLAERAAEKGNAEHVSKCLKHKKDNERQAMTLHTQIEKNEQSLEALHKQAEQQDDRINEHEVSTAVLAAREAGLRMRQKMVSSSSSFGGENSLGDLEAYQRQIDEKEWELDALEGMANKDVELETLYGDNGDSAIDAEAAELMSKFNKNKSVEISE